MRECEWHSFQSEDLNISASVQLKGFNTPKSHRAHWLWVSRISISDIRLPPSALMWTLLHVTTSKNPDALVNSMLRISQVRDQTKEEEYERFTEKRKW